MSRVYSVVSGVFLVTAILLSGYALITRLDGPVIDAFGFRQTQTAISAFYIMHGGPILSYETPVLGAPWSLPFEFPTYQVIVAAIAAWTGHLDAVGRLVSYTFFLGCFYPISRLYRFYSMPPGAMAATGVLILASPLYVLYSRAFMIETAALFFSLMWLWLFCDVICSRHLWTGFACLLFGALAILTKSTTFPPVVVGGFVFLLAALAQEVRGRAFRSAGTMILTAGLVTLPAIAAGYLWVVWTDVLKEQNIFAHQLTSAFLWNWNFGYPGLRTSAKFWYTIRDRMSHDVFGHSELVAVALWVFAIVSERTRLVALASLSVVLSGLLFFPNLHTIHNYYQTALAMFAIVPCALGVAALVGDKLNSAAAVALAVVAVCQLYASWFVVRETIEGEPLEINGYRVARAAAETLPPGSGLLVFGTDWSSEVPYYAERRTFAVPGWAEDAQIAEVVADPSKVLGGLPLGGIIVCKYGVSAKLIDPGLKMAEGMNLKASSGPCSLYTPR